jgi:hypothetical protein
LAARCELNPKCQISPSSELFKYLEIQIFN